MPGPSAKTVRPERAARAPGRASLALGLVLAACAGAQRPPEGAEAKEGAAPGPAMPSVPRGLVAGMPDAPRVAQSLFTQAVGLGASDPVGAAAYFERAFELDPRLAMAAYDAGVLHERAGNVDRARHDYARALQASPDLEPASQNLTRLRIRAGLAAEAEADLRARIARYPASPGLRNQLVEVLIATGRLDPAEQESRKVLKEDERNVAAMVNLATVYHRERRYELARAVLENARQVDPSEPAVWNKLGFVDLALGNRAHALEDFKKAASLRADYPEAHANYGAMLVETEDYPGAVRELELAVQYAPTSAGAHLDLGNAYRGARELDKAQREYERALQLDPRLADAWYDLAILYLDGDKPGLPATERLERALGYFEKYAAAGGTDARLAQYRRDAASQLEREKKRIAREEKDRLRKAAEARKKEAAPPPPPAVPAGEKPGGKGEER